VRKACIVAALALLGGCHAPDGNLRPDTHLPAGYAIDCEGTFDTAPRLVSGKSPVFPASVYNPDFIEDRKIRHLPLHWQVDTRFEVLPDGRTARIRSGATQPAFFATHTNAAIQAWRFSPALRDGTAVAASCTHVLTFRLDA
jgi:hypothetical protein